jgi:hypothetical protein
VVSAAPLTNSKRPTISGTVKFGQTLTATPGTWSPSTITASYQWLRGGLAISGAKKGSYVLVAADIGQTITVQVTASKVGHVTTSTTSKPTVTVVPGTVTNSVKPSITGTAKVGQMLTAKPGTWSPTSVTFTYRWLRAGVAISGATTSTYILTAADIGKKVTVKVTVAKTGYATASATSIETAAVVMGTLTSAVPTISGTASVGKTLTAKPGAWGPETVTLTYQWLRTGVAISGATTSTYKLTAADAGVPITVRVTGKKSGYSDAAKTSATVTPKK